MADRFFVNQMLDYVPESPDNQQQTMCGEEDLLMQLLSMNYKSVAARLERQALDIKENVVIETWGRTGQKVDNFTLYTGSLGTAFLLFKAYQVTKNVNDLNLCSEIVKACDLASNSRDVTFICGRTGVCAIGAVAAKHAGNHPLLNCYLKEFNQIRLPKSLPNELLYGRVGFLWSCLFINKHIGQGAIASEFMRPIVSEIIESGRRMPHKGKWPLMYEWYGERYWGAAHGLAGIMHVLMETNLLRPDELEYVKNTLICMIQNRFPSGNYPASEGDSGTDVLVHWCHGAPGVALTLVKAYEVFKDKLFLEAAAEAAEVVWNRGLLKRVGICHGISGNAYAFLALYRITRNLNYLYRAKAFACFLLEKAHKLIASGEMHGGDNPYSLFEGIGGMAYLFLDMIEPLHARFPAYEL